MAVGLGTLRLPPAQFWAMSPRELAAALGGHGGDPAGPMPRAALDGLIRLFPDP